MLHPQSPHNAVDVQVLLLLGKDKGVSTDDIKKYFSKYEKLQEVFWGYEDTNLIFTKLENSKDLNQYFSSSIYDLIVFDQDSLVDAPELLLIAKGLGVPILFIKSVKEQAFKVDNIIGYEEAYWSDRRSLIKSVRRSVRNALQHALSFQINRDRLVSKILETFIGSSNFELEKLIPKALEEVGIFCAVDRAHVWNFNYDKSLISKSFHWASSGVKFHYKLKEQIPTNFYPWIISQIKAKKVVSFSDYSQIPKSANSERELLEKSSTLSFLAVPLVLNGNVLGFIGFSCVNKKRKWGARTISLQKTMAKILVNTMEVHNSRQALVRFEDYFSNITDNLKEGLIITDGDGVIEQINPSAKKMLVLKEVDCLNKKVKKILGSEAYSEIMLSLKSKKDGTTYVPEAIEFCDSEKNCKWLKFNAASSAEKRIFDLKNKIVIIISDITAQRKIEDQLRHSQSMEALGRVAGGVAHDFNNLLTAVLGYSGLLLDKMPQDSEYRSEIIQIKKAGEQACSLVNHLLTFSRKKVLRPKNTDISSVVSESAEILKRLIPKNIIFNIDLVKDLPKIKIDPLLLQQIVMNLVINARDAMPQGGKLSIVTKLEGSSMGIVDSNNVILSIKDTGSGISDEVLPNIFEPFFTTKEEGKGTGLGLSTVYGAVKQSGAEIKVNSELGQGTEFLITFPQAKLKKLSPTLLRSNLLRSNLVVERNKETCETVLLVEDDLSMRHLIKQVLLSKSYKVLEASNGKEALRISKKYPFNIDLLITDIVMPDTSGIEVINEFVSNRAETKILIISGYIKRSSLSKILSNINCAFLKKPFSTNQFLFALEALFDNDAKFDAESLLTDISEST